ncbi:hypothetical protein BDR07DRAFT_1430177, partial [Suillus spraguei]
MFQNILSWWSPTSTPAPAPALKKKYVPTNPKMNPLNPQGLKSCCACQKRNLLLMLVFFRTAAKKANVLSYSRSMLNACEGSDSTS